MKNKYFKLLLLQIFVIVFILLLYTYTHSDLVNLTPYCVWKENYNVLCPSCGSTRCIINLLNGNLGTAFSYNPFLFILIFYLLFLDFLYIINTIFNKKYLKFLYPKWWFVVIYFVLWFIYTIFINIF